MTEKRELNILQVQLPYILELYSSQTLQQKYETANGSKIKSSK